MVGVTGKAPARGDVAWMDLDPQAGREQAGRRPVIVISPEHYNAKTGLALFCPVTTRIKGYPYEVIIPEGLPVSGAVLSDRVKSLDWRARKTEWICCLPVTCMAEVTAKLNTLIL